MFKFGRDSYVDVDLYEERISGRGYILVDKEMIQNTALYLSAKRDSMGRLALRIMNAEGGCCYISLSPQAVLKFLIESKGCTEQDFKNKKTKGLSLDAGKVLSRILERGYAEEFLTTYIEYTSLDSICNRVPGLLQALEDCGDVSISGKKLYRLHYNVNQQENLRYNYRDEDLISIPSEFKKSFSVEKGYCIVWGDFAQADFRIGYNTLLRDASNEEVFLKYPDSYRALVYLVTLHAGEEFVDEAFSELRPAYKQNALETLYGTEKGGPKSHKIISRLSSFYRSCGRYSEYLRRIDNAIELGLPIEVQDYFGYPQVYGVDTKYPRNTRNKCLNTPGQTATSNLIILTVNKILDSFYELGYTEDDISVYMVRHDEPIFRVKLTALKDAWIFKNAEVIQVDDWTPLGMEFSYGYNYLVPDQDLTSLAHAAYDAHPVDTVEPSPAPESYMPIKDILVLGVSYEVLGGSTVAAIYEDRTRGARSIVIPSTDPSTIIPAVHEIISASADRIKDMGYAGVLVYNETDQKDMYGDGVFVRYLKKDPADNCRSKAYVLAHYLAARLAKDKNISFFEDSGMLQANVGITSKVGELSVLVQRKDTLSHS